MNIRCPSCQTAYDVSGRPAGTLLTCHCGEDFVFSKPAATPLPLQCPGCGAGADRGDRRCQYCDRPLRSVCCPSCFTLLFAGDQHCGQCGSSVLAPALVVHRDGAGTLPCPRCSVALTASLAGDQLFDRCDRCGGIWAHHVAIDGILASKRRKLAMREWLAELPATASAYDNREPAPCPDCEQAMELHRVPKNRHVLIDVCSMHGVWFDYREIRTLVGQNRRRREPGRSKYRRVRNRSQFASFLDNGDDWWPWEALEELLESLVDLFD